MRLILHLFLGKDGFQIPRCVHLLEDVEAADQFTVNVKLRIRWPTGIRLQTLSNFVVAENVEGAELGVQTLQEFDGLSAKSALRCRRIALHEEHTFRSVDQLLDSDLQGFGLVD